jgi:hypothetical protein
MKASIKKSWPLMSGLQGCQPKEKYLVCRDANQWRNILFAGMPTSGGNIWSAGMPTSGEISCLQGCRPEEELSGRQGYQPEEKMSGRQGCQPEEKKEVPTVFPWVRIAISNFRKVLVGIHHGVKSAYLQNYHNEFCNKFNRRYMKNDLFDSLIFNSVKFSWYQNG